MGTYQDGYEAGRNGALSAGSSDVHESLGFQDGLHERQKREHQSGRADGAGLSPFALIGGIVLCVFFLAVGVALVTGVVSAFVIVALTPVMSGSVKARPSYGAAYGLAVAGMTAWLGLTTGIVWLVASFQIQPFRDVGVELAELCHLGHWEKTTTLEWSNPQTIAVLAAMFAPGAVAHGAILSRVGRPYAGLIGFLKSLVVSSAAIVVGLGLVVALVRGASALGVRFADVENLRLLLVRSAFYLGADVIVTSALGMVVLRVGTAQRGWLSFYRLYKTALFCLLVYAAVSAVVVLVRAQVAPTDPFVETVRAFLAPRDPWRAIGTRHHAYSAVIPMLLLVQVPGWLAMSFVLIRKLRVSSRGKIGALRSLAMAFLLLVGANASLFAIAFLLPATKLNFWGLDGT